MHWVIVLLIVVLVFGTKKLTGVGSDLGKAIKEFKDGVNGVEKKDDKLTTTVTNVDKS